MPRSAPLACEALERLDGVVGGDAGRDVHRQRFAGELVDDVEQLDRAAVDGLIELEVDRPHVPRPLGAQPIGRNRGLAETLALAPPRRNPQALLAPQPLHALAVNHPALIDQLRVRAAVSPPGPPNGDLTQRGSQRPLVAGDDGFTALRGPVLADHPAGPALADAETVTQHRDRPTPTGRAHQFPRATSLSAWFSSTWSATIFFSRAFSRSSSLRRLASSAFIPPNWRCQR